MRVYIAGPMSGLPDHNFPAFDAAAAALRAAGHRVVNPAEITRRKLELVGGRAAFEAAVPEEEDRYAIFMKGDIIGLLTCEAVLLLDGWARSRGATLEATIARRLRLRFLVLTADGRLERDVIEQSVGDFAKALARAEGGAFAVAGDTELEVAEKLLAEATEVLDRIPECPAHGKGCHPHQRQWITAGIALRTAVHVRRPQHIGSASGQSKGDPSESVLAEADRLVSGDRQSSYGHPLDNFARIASLWGEYLGGRHGRATTLDQLVLTAEDVALMMVLLKVARLENGFHRDSVVDVAGYAKCLDLISQERAKRAEVAV